MKLRLGTYILLTTLIIEGCYLPIKGRVVDAETGVPIEGAVVLVEWTKKHGFGDAWTESYKVVETLSDRDGYVKIAGCYSPFVESPDIAIYKMGYVTWSSRNIFPSWKNRDDFQWQSGNIYKLEKFKEAYSYSDHESFTSRAINDTIGWANKRLFIKIYEDSEREKVVKEQNKKDLEKMRGPL